MGPTRCNAQWPPPTHEKSPAKVETEANFSELGKGLGRNAGSQINYTAPCQVADESAEGSSRHDTGFPYYLQRLAANAIAKLPTRPPRTLPDAHLAPLTRGL